MANQIPIILSAGRQRQIPNADNLIVFGIVVATGSIASNRPMLNLSQTWNNAGVDFTGIDLNITNTNSGPASLVFNLKVDTNPICTLSTNGDFFANSISVLNFIDTPKINNLNANGLVTVSNGDGTLGVDTSYHYGYFWHRSCI